MTIHGTATTSRPAETTSLLAPTPSVVGVDGGSALATTSSRSDRGGCLDVVRRHAGKVLLALVLGVAIIGQTFPKASTRRPNILVLFPDQLRHDWVNSDTSSDILITPHLDYLRRHGVTFQRAIAASPLCAPSRACFATASNYDQAGVLTNVDNLPKDRVTFYKLLEKAGYHTMAVGKLDLNKRDNLDEFGWGRLGNEHAAEWGFSSMVNCAGPIEAAAETVDLGSGSFNEPYMEFLRLHRHATSYQSDIRSRSGGMNQYTKTDPTSMADEFYMDNWITDQALALLDDTPHGRDWFLIVNWNSPHPPMDITQSMFESVLNKSFPPPVDPSADLTPAQHNQIRRNYAAKIQNLDEQIGRILDAVDLADTLVVFASDHGEMLGDRGLWGKKSPFQASIGVPLVIAGATNFTVVSDALRGASSMAAVSLIDVAQTLMDIGRVGDVPGSMAEATSLRAILNGSHSGGSREVKSGLGPWRLRFDGRYKVVAGYGKELLVFDLDSDPHERHNLASTPDLLPSRVVEMMRQLRNGTIN